MIHEKKYIAGQVPDDLFTRNELQQMGRVALDPQTPDALVYFPDQKREYKLFKLENTRVPKKQIPKGIKLTTTDRSVEDILAKRKNFKKVYKNNFRNQ